MAAGTMKTSYYLVAAAGLTAAAATAYDHLPARAETPAATLPLPHDSAALVPMPAVPDLPLPAIVPPPDGPLVIPVSGTPAPLPALPTTPTIPPPPSFPANPVETSPPPVAPALPGRSARAHEPADHADRSTCGNAAVAPATPIVPEIPPSVSPPSVAPPPAPVLPGAPPAPRPLPILPAPTPLTPGLETLKPEPAAKLAPAGKLIVLRGNKLVEGMVTTNGDRIIVRRGALDRAFDRVDVLYVADTRDEVYRFMLAKVAPTNADARLAVAKWCTLHGLREQALAEAREIVKLQPTHRGAADLARSMEESLRQFPPEGSTQKPRGSLVTVIEPEVDVAPEAAASFVAQGSAGAGQSMHGVSRSRQPRQWVQAEAGDGLRGRSGEHACEPAVSGQSVEERRPTEQPNPGQGIGGAWRDEAAGVRDATGGRVPRAGGMGRFRGGPHVDRADDAADATGLRAAPPITPIPPAVAAEPQSNQPTAPLSLPVAAPALRPCYRPHYHRLRQRRSCALRYCRRRPASRRPKPVREPRHRISR